MSELELYKKMYARTVGGVDGVLQLIADALTSENWGRETLIEAGAKLKETLLEAEELYLSADEKKDG